MDGWGKVGIELRYGIVTMSSPRVATANTLHTQPKTFERSIFFKSLNGILGTGGNEAAFRSKQRRKNPLIEFDQCNERE